mmetsp:Transcript_18054/g.35994  ORF Transcript_18054/g.35994 Transcript_18054/m.35994 type:complete len:216 (+) Transcript_18054:445-1092(+)
MAGFCPHVEFSAMVEVEATLSLSGAKSSEDRANFLLDFFPLEDFETDFFLDSLSASRISFSVGTDPRGCSEYHFFFAISSSIEPATASTAVGGVRPRTENSSKTSMFRRNGWSTAVFLFCLDTRLRIFFLHPPISRKTSSVFFFMGLKPAKGSSVTAITSGFFSLVAGLLAEVGTTKVVVRYLARWTQRAISISYGIFFNSSSARVFSRADFSAM